MRSHIISRAFGVLVAAFIPFLAHAQSIVLTPAVVELTGKQGQSVTQALSLRNDSATAIEFTLEARDVVVRGGARAFIEAGQLPDSIAASAVFFPRTVRIAPHASGTVTVTMTLPAAMRHRAVTVYFRGTTVVKAAGRDTRLSLGTLFTFTVSDAISVTAAALEADPPTADRNAQLRARLVNDGTEPAVPSGMAVILDASGQPVGKTHFRAKRLLPGEQAVMVADYAGDLAPGTYRAVATFDIAGRPLNLTSLLTVP